MFFETTDSDTIGLIVLIAALAVVGLFAWRK